MLKRSRVLAGHILWPTYNKKYTTNMARGGPGFYDKIDVTLFLLQIYMDNKYYIFKSFPKEDIVELLKKNFSVDRTTDKVLLVIKSFHNYREFYLEIENFRTFCEIHNLFGSFVKKNGDEIIVNNFDKPGTTDFLPISEPSERYNENNLKAIDLRQEQIFGLL